MYRPIIAECQKNSKRVQGDCKCEYCQFPGKQECQKQGFVKYHRCTAHQHVEPTEEELGQASFKEASCSA